MTRANEAERYATQGDKILDKPLSEIGGRSLSMQEFESKLLRGAAHLLRDCLLNWFLAPALLACKDIILVSHRAIFDTRIGSRVMA